jgi:hypothetical protein
MMQVYEVLGTLEHAVEMACEKIRELQVKVHEQAEQLKAKDEAIRNALNELGVPGPKYPAPVTNAVEILGQALKGGE